jgi:arsenate reductase
MKDSVSSMLCVSTEYKNYLENYEPNTMTHEQIASFAGQPMPMRVLFLCTHNSSRSQMAEGLLRARGGQAYQVFSAGTQPRTVHPLAIQVMAELNIDISGHWSKGMGDFDDQPSMDLVVTVCDEAAETCPFFRCARSQEHWGFPDPSAAIGTEEERLAVFRQVRDAIAVRIDRYVEQRRNAKTFPQPAS